MSLRRSIEGRATAVWKHPSIPWIIISGASACWLWFWFWPPLPGVAVAVFGGAAAILAFRSMSSIQKLFATLAIFSLIGIELRDIRKDRTESDRLQQRSRSESEAHFKAIADSIRENINDVTGGDSFPYMTILPIENGVTHLVVDVHGTYRLRQVGYRLVVGRPPFKPKSPDLYEMISETALTPLGDLRANYALTLPVTLHPLTDGGHYAIFLSAGNGDWNEEMDLKPPVGNTSAWTGSITVRQNGKVIFKMPDK